MSLGHICWAISAVVLLLLGFDVISSTGKIHLELVALGLIPLGLLLTGIGFASPVTIARRE